MSNNATAEAEVKSTLSETQEADKQKWLPVLKDIAAFEAAGGTLQDTEQETPELEAWFGRLEPALEEFYSFLDNENSSWWKSDKEFAMLLLFPRAFDDLSDELKEAVKEKAAKEIAENDARVKAYIEENGAKIAEKLGVRVDQIVCYI